MVGEIERTFHVDSSVVRAHQQAAGVRRERRRRGPARAAVAVPAVVGEAIGRSRGGLSSNIHLAVDAEGRAGLSGLTAGQARNNRCSAMFRWPRQPRNRPDRIVADKACSHPSTSAALRRCKVAALQGRGAATSRRREVAVTIPERSDQVAPQAVKDSAIGRRPA
ncbi:hypothetical protein [Cryptosporangium aurantiacum]|uniref:hypothetical protein n=1 Tax=Cryptosporangium aurantiacum TaxID=134849 RepID=UPI001160F481|nr:hypothetical protein [Cryptosporangium aurantiacum]